MEYLITGALIGVCLFFIPFWAYRRGLQDGLKLNQGKPIEPIQNPVKSFVEYREKVADKKETKEANSTLISGFNNIMSYDGTPQKEAGEK